MKTALLLSGNARFCNDFDTQLANLQNSEIDWIVVFWNRDSSFDRYISPSWHATTAEEARSIIEPRLPQGHQLAHIEIVDTAIAPKPPRKYKEFYCNSEALWNQYWILQLCDQRRQIAGQYDLVIRSRPDISISRPIDLKQLRALLQEMPNKIFIPQNRSSSGFNDQFAIGLPDAIHRYAQAIDHFDYCYTDQGTLFNPEYLMARALTNLGLSWPATDFTCGLRPNGNNIPINFGRWGN